MADFLSRLMDDSSNVYEDTQNSIMPLNRDGQEDFVLSCMDTQSQNSQTFEFMKMHNSDVKESNLEVIREEDSSFFHNMQLDFEEAQVKNHNKDSMMHNLNSNKVFKSLQNQQENSKEQLVNNNKGNNYGNNLTEKILKISQEIDDIYEETQRSESVKTKDLGIKDLSSTFTMNKVNVHPPSTISVGSLGYQANNLNNSNNQQGASFLTNNQQSTYGNFNQANASSTANTSVNFQTGKNYTVTNINPHSSFVPANNLASMNTSNNFSSNYCQNPKLNLLNNLNPSNSMNPNNSILPSNTTNLKTKTKTNINYAPTVNVSNNGNNGTPVGFYNEGMSASANNTNNTNNTNNFNNQNKAGNYPNPSNNFKNTAPSNFELCNSFRVETDEHIKKTLAIFDHIKLNFCNFIENYKNKFIHDAELIKQVLIGETEFIIQEEDKNKMIDSRMEALFRDMMNILNEFQRY